MLRDPNPLPSPAEMRDLIAAELAGITDPACRATLERCLMEPELRMLNWDYGPEDRYACWLVGRSPDGVVAFAYCNSGFGPSFPWGFVYADRSAMGTDAQWHSGLLDAALCYGVLEALPDYEVPGPRGA